GGGGTGSDGTGGTGSDGGGGTNPTDPGPSTGPTYPTTHPRIYLTPNRVRLTSALTSRTPAAMRFKSMVDSWLAGNDVYNFSAWNAALIGQLTNNTSYCTKAVSASQAQGGEGDAQQ